MASPTVTSAAELVAEYYDRFLLDNLYPDLYFWQFGDKKRVPPGMGKTFHFTRYKKLTTTQAIALTEGTILGTCAMSATRVSATLAGYGIAVKHSDFLIMTGLSDIVTDSVNEVSKGLALRIDQTVRVAVCTKGTLIGSSNMATVKMGGAGAGFAVRGSDIIKSVAKLRKTDAKTFPDGNFVGIAHPNFFHDLQTLTSAGNWVDVNKYASNTTVGLIYRGEVGKLYGVRFVMSSNIPKLLGSAANSGTTGLSGVGGSGYNAFIFGPGAYGVVNLDGGSAKTYIKQLGSAGTADPINQHATVGAKVYFAAVDMDSTNRLIRMVHPSETV